MTMTEPKNIHEAIIGVMKEVGYVQKQKKGTLKYSYAGEAALIAALRPAMINHNITMQSTYPTVEFGAFTTNKGYVMNSARVHGEFTFTHAPTETNIVVRAIGEGMDTGDKAIYKAMTGAFKYALRQTFVIETGDDPDKERQEETTEPEERKPFTEPVSKKQFPPDVAENLRAALVAAKVLPPDTHNIHFATFLDLVPFNVDVPTKELVGWGKMYRGYKDETGDTDEAVRMASEAWFSGDPE
jgi:hypothetical protein